MRYDFKIISWNWYLMYIILVFFHEIDLTIIFFFFQDEDEDDLDNENSLRSIEAKLDRALSDVSHLTVDNLASSLSQSLVSGDLPTSERQLFFSGENASNSTSQSSNETTNTTDVVSLASSLAHLVETMNLGDDPRSSARNRNKKPPAPNMSSTMTSMASSDVSNTTNSGRANTKSFSKLWDFSASEDFSVNVTPPPAFPPPPPPPPTSTSTSDVPMDTASNRYAIQINFMIFSTKF